MAELIAGKEYISFFRILKNKATEDGAKVLFATESSISKSKEVETTVTKDGPVTSISDGENTADFTSLAYREDTGIITMWKKLEEAFDDNEKIEFWNVDAGSLTAEREVDATYHQGYFTSFEMTAGEGNVELSYSYAINGKGVKGTDTLTEAQIGALDSLYEYETIAATGV